MSYRTRILILIGVIELLLAAFYVYALGQPGSPEQITERGRLIGMLMGFFAGITPLLYLLARNNDGKKAERQKAE